MLTYTDMGNVGNSDVGKTLMSVNIGTQFVVNEVSDAV